MWFVKDELGNCHFKNDNLIKCSNFANWYNKNHKFCGQRMFKFNLYSFTSVSLFNSHEDLIDINKFTLDWSMFRKPNYLYQHPFSVKNFDKKHKNYLKLKLEKVKTLCKKYHVWPYNEYGRKCDGFDF